MCKSLIMYKHTNYKYEIRGNWGERFNPRLPSKVVQSKVRSLAFMWSVKYANLKMCDQLHKFVICKCEIWDLGRKWEVPDRGGLVESCWDECEIRALLCSVWSPSSSNFSSSSSSSLGPALSYTSQFSSFVSYLLYLQREDRSFLQFHTSSFLQFELSLFFSLDSIYISTAHWHSVLYCDLSEPTFSKHPSERKWVDPICAEYGKVAVTKIRKADAPCILSTILTNRLFSVVVQTKECCPTFTGSSVFDRGSEISKYGRPD